nr:hypothetical protein [Lysobacter enzymogenes]
MASTVVSVGPYTCTGARRPLQRAQQRRRHRFAADQEQRRRLEARQGVAPLQERRRQVAQADAFARDPLQVGAGVGAFVVAGNAQRGAARQAQADLDQAGVEAQRSELGDAAVRIDAEALGLAVGELDQLAMFDHHPLGIAGGAGGVDDVGQMLRTEIGALRRGVGAALDQGRIVEREQRPIAVRAGRGEGAAAFLVGQRAHRRGVGEHAGETRRGVGRVQRHVGAAGLEHGQDRDDRVGAALRAQRYAPVGADAGRDQAMGEAVGGGVERGVAPARAGVFERDRLGRVLGLLFEQMMEAGFARIVGVGAVPVVQQLPALVRADQLEAGDRARRILGQRAQRGEQVATMTFDRRRREQRGGVTQAADQGAGAFAQLQFQVELGASEFQLQHLRVDPGQLEDGFVLALPGQHGLEQRRAVGAARRVQRFDHALERQRVVLRVERAAARALDQLVGVGLAGQIDAQGQGVDEEADQRLAAGPVALRVGRADDNLGLSGQAREHQRPRGEHQREQAGAVAARAPAQRLGQRGFDPQRQQRAVEALQRRARLSGRQVQQCRRVGQGGAPVLLQRIHRFALVEPALLPGGVVGELPRQRRQRIGPALDEGGVQRAQVARQRPQRFAVGDDMVKGQQQMEFVVAAARQQRPRRRAAFEIEGGFGFALERVAQCRVAGAAQVAFAQRECAGLGRQLQARFAADGDETRAQAGMTRRQRVQRRAQRGDVE